MIPFRTFIKLNEGKYPMWVRFTVGGMVLKVRSLSKQIESETDLKRQNNLISQQNKIISYINGLTIGVGTDDQILLKKLKTMK